MTTKEELKTKKRHRYMLRGNVGSGKTHNLVMLAMRYATEGKHVLFIDFKDVGATEALEKLDSEVLELIDYETPSSYLELLQTKIGDTINLIIIDAMHHLRFSARKFIREEYIKQGHYTTGGAEIAINDVDTFDLGVLGYGTGFSAANIRENDIVDMLMNSGKDIAISVIPEIKTDIKGNRKESFTDILGANFDNIIDLSFTDSEDGKREWFYKIYRWRGIESNNYSAQCNEGDPFEAIENTGGKPVKEYMVRCKVAGKSKKEFIKAIDAKGAEAELRLMWPEADEVEVIE